MIKANKQINGSKVVIMGVTFKENTPDVRNTKVIDVVRELEEYGVKVSVVDPVADGENLKKEYGIELKNLEDIYNFDAVVLAVPHDEFKDITLDDLKKLYRVKISNEDSVDEVAATMEENDNLNNERYVLIDVKGMFNRKEAESTGFDYWRL